MLKHLATLSALMIVSGICPAQGPVIVEKRCSNCNRVVSSSSKAGDTCPFCGTTWASDEGSQVKPKAMRSPKSAAIPSEAPPSIDKTIGRYAIVIAGLAVSALVVTLTVRFLMNNIWHNI